VLNKQNLLIFILSFRNDNDDDFASRRDNRPVSSTPLETRVKTHEQYRSNNNNNNKNINNNNNDRSAVHPRLTDTNYYCSMYIGSRPIWLRDVCLQLQHSPRDRSLNSLRRGLVLSDKPDTILSRMRSRRDAPCSQASSLGGKFYDIVCLFRAVISDRSRVSPPSTGHTKRGGILYYL